MAFSNMAYSTEKVKEPHIKNSSFYRQVHRFDGVRTTAIKPNSSLKNHQHKIISNVDEAEILNTRFSNTVSHCDDGTTSAYKCSGVLVSVTSDDPDAPIWESDTDLGRQSYSYMRKNANLEDLYNASNNGIILKSNNLAINDNQIDVQETCSYPYDSFSAGRKDLGCGKANAYGTCESIGG